MNISKFFIERPIFASVIAVFIVLIGAYLILEGFGIHIPKGYLYGAMGFSAAVECLNLWSRKRANGRQLAQ